jgi:hypothetical protein
MGSRCYFEVGPVTLQVVEVPDPHCAAKALYFATGEIEAVYRRADALQCLSTDSVHGVPAGSITVKPWGERSFYCADPWGNPLCFVDEGTIYAG